MLVSCLPELVSSDLFCLYSFMFIFSLSIQTVIRWLTHSVSSAHLCLSHSLCLTYLSHCIKNTSSLYLCLPFLPSTLVHTHKYPVFMTNRQQQHPFFATRTFAHIQHCLKTFSSSYLMFSVYYYIYIYFFTFYYSFFCSFHSVFLYLIHPHSFGPFWGSDYTIKLADLLEHDSK